MLAPTTTCRAPSGHGFFMTVLRRQIGHGRRFMPTAFAKMIHSAVPTVEGWLNGRASPSISRLPAMEAVCGESLIRDLLAELGYAGAYKVKPEGVCPNKHASALASALRDLLTALEDKRIDHIEANKLIPIFRRLASECGAFAADLEKGKAA